MFNGGISVMLQDENSLEFKIKPRFDMETKTFRLPVPMVEKLEKLSSAYNISVNSLVIQCIEFALLHLK